MRRFAKRVSARWWSPGHASWVARTPVGELALGFVPSADRRQHAAVEDATFGVEERAAVPRDELVGDLAPLGCPLGVAGELAGIEHVAARVDDRVEVACLAAEDRRHRLVDLRQTAGDVAPPDIDEAELRGGDELEVDIADRPGEIERPPRQLLGVREIRHPVRPGDPQRGVSRARADRFEQPLGACNPAVGGGEVGEVRLVGDAKPQRAPDRAVDVAGPAEQRVRGRALLDAFQVLAEPPHRRRQTESRLRRVARGERLGEGVAGLDPSSCGKRGGADRREVVGLHRGLYTATRWRFPQAIVTVSISTSLAPDLRAPISIFDTHALSR